MKNNKDTLARQWKGPAAWRLAHSQCEEYFADCEREVTKCL